MIVPEWERDRMHVEYDFDSQPNFFPGYIGQWTEAAPEPSRPIGFRMPDPEPGIDDPSWLLL